MRQTIASPESGNRSTFCALEDNSGDKLGKTLGAKMANAKPLKTSGAIEFVETTSRRRAITYRERATHLLNLADTEPNGSLRTKLLELSAQYEELAESLAVSRGG